MEVAKDISLTGKAQTPDDAALQKALQERGELPRHVAIIMDGNGRWAEARGRSRVAGHNEGVESVRDITEAAAQLGVEVLTLYTFSTENWYRPASEVNALMRLLIHTLRREKRRLLDNDIRLRSIGDASMLPDACRAELDDAIDATAENTRMTLNLALSYSGRWDIVHAARVIAERVRAGVMEPGDVDDEAFAAHLTTAALPDPDLLIRTGGEERVSNFLLWEMAYTELYFTELFWPDFRRERLYDAISDFQDRERRFGRVDES